MEGEDGRGGGNFVDDVRAIGGIVDVGLEIIGEAVFRVVLFDEVFAEAELEKEIDAYLDKGFADDGAIFVRAFDYSYFQIWKTLPEVAGCELACCSASHH